MTAQRRIYLDNAATTAVSREVADLVVNCMCVEYGNASSAHHMGIAAERLIKRARDQMRTAIGDTGGELGTIVWTSGGTEGDALGVIGPARAHHRRGKRLVYSSIEHPAVRESMKLLEREGFTAVSAPVLPSGVVDVDTFVAAVDDTTTVVALMLVNNEIGTVQPVADVAAALKARYPDIHIHCDAVQALGKIEIDVAELGVDSMAFAAHKIHGPKGSGALWVNSSANLVPLWAGGGQQSGTRPGTFNVPGIAGLGKAAELAVAGMAESGARYGDFAATLLEAARGSGIPVAINGEGAPRAPHVLSLGFTGVPAEPLLHALESRGVLVSAGSACSERDRKPSPVLTALKLSPDVGTLRFSFSALTTAADVAEAASILSDTLPTLV